MGFADRAALHRLDAIQRPDLAARSLELARIYERAARRQRREAQMALPLEVDDDRERRLYT